MTSALSSRKQNRGVSNLECFVANLASSKRGREGKTYEKCLQIINSEMSEHLKSTRVRASSSSRFRGPFVLLADSLHVGVVLQGVLHRLQNMLLWDNATVLAEWR